MNDYNIYTATEAEKYRIINIIRAAGAKLTGVSGCGTGYYIQLDATPDQVREINQGIDNVLHLYSISADNGASWTEQWLTSQEAESHRNAGFLAYGG